LGDPYDWSVVKFCEIADEIVPYFIQLLSGVSLTTEQVMGRRLMEREKNPDLSLPKTEIDKYL
jgi:hypothetical protein